MGGKRMLKDSCGRLGSFGGVLALGFPWAGLIKIVACVLTGMCGLHGGVSRPFLEKPDTHWEGVLGQSACQAVDEMQVLSVHSVHSVE